MGFFYRLGAGPEEPEGGGRLRDQPDGVPEGVRGQSDKGLAAAQGHHAAAGPQGQDDPGGGQEPDHRGLPMGRRRHEAAAQRSAGRAAQGAGGAVREGFRGRKGEAGEIPQVRIKLLFVN